MIAYIILGILVIIVLLYLTAIMPRMIHRADRKPFSGICYAHRGLHDNHSHAPENSIAAFALAVEQGYGIELDVQLTKDKIPVVFHDYSLKRACGVDKKVQELMYQELLQYNLFESQQKIPRFEEVLDIIDGKVPLIVELKVEWDAGETCRLANEILNRYQGIYCIESFSPFALVWYKKHNPDILRGQLASDFIKDKTAGDKKAYFAVQNLLTNCMTRPDFIAYNYKYRKKLSFVLCRRLFGALTFAWTIQSQEAFDTSEKSFDGFIFDSFLLKM
jgi:Glycerophosphoryl diester phosphodiesterase